MKKIRHLSALMSISLLFIIVGCFGPKQSSSSKEAKERMEERERKERQARKRQKNSRIPEKAHYITGAAEEDEEENEKYDGVQAAQQREYNMTHDPATNTLPKDRLFSALQKRDALIQLQKKQGSLTQGTGSGTNGVPLLPITGINWEERGSYADAVGPSNGNGRDSNAVTSGRITAFFSDLDPTKPNQVFVGGIDGGLWSCPDITVSPAAWTFIDNFANLGISSITQDPTNYNIMYFGTGEKSINADAVLGGGVWKSIDHGLTWNLMSNTVDFKQVSKVLCDKNGYVYVGTNYKSTTIGVSSRGIGLNVGLVRSKDGGANWENITPTVGGLVTPRVSDMVYDPSRDTMHVFMGYYPSIDTIKVGYCYGKPSTVTSSTWNTPTSAATGLGMFISTTPQATFLYQTVLAVKNGVVWALRSNYNNTTAATSMPLYRSLDGGATWTQQSTQTDGSGQGWYSIALDCDPQDPANKVIFASLDVLRSTNGGTTFTQVARWVTSGASNQYVHADGHNVYWNTNASGLNRAIVCSDGGIFYSNNGGLNWADRNIGLRIKQFYSSAISPSVPNYYLAGAQDNGSHQFTQPGLGTSTEVTGGDGCIVAIDQLNPKNQVASYVYNAYYISTDGGISWASRTWGSSAGLFVNPFDVDSKTKKMYSAYTAGTYLRWDDPFTTRNTSTAVTVPLLNGLIATAVTVSTNLANTIYLATNTSAATPFLTRVMKVVNANTNTPTATDITPAAVTPGSVISSIVLGPSVTDQDIIITSSSFGAKKVFVTADGGTNWTEVTGNLPDLPVRWSMYYPGSNTQIMLATEAGIWINSNGVSNGNSTNWLPSVGFPAVRSDMIKYSPTMGTAVVGTHGRGLWTAKLSTNPKISYYNTLLSVSKNFGSAITGCRTYMDYLDTLIISEAPTGTATVTLSALPGGTAVLGADYDFTTNGSFTSPSNIVTFTSGVYPQKIPIVVRVYNTHDKNAVLPQTATIGFTVTGTTDAVAAPVNQVLTVNFTDVLPSSTTLTAQTLWTENWESAADGYANWTFTPDIYHSKPANTTGFLPYFSSCISNINGVTAQLATTDAAGGLLCANGNGGAYTARMYRMVNAANNRYSAMTVTFNYRSGTTANIVNTLVYSTNNGATWTTIATYPARSAVAATAVTTTIPTTLNNTNFLLGWQSVGQAAATYSPYGFAVDDIVLSGTIAPGSIDSIAGSTDTTYIAANQSIDFYSANNNILANIANSSQTLACTNVTIENAGKTWQPFAGGNRSQKTFFVSPSQNTGATYNATFYFTTGELAGMNTNTLRIAKTTANSMAEANNSNTVFVTPTTVAAYSVNGVANGFGFTGAFTGFSRFFLVDGNASVPIAFTTCPTTNLAIARPGYNVYNNEPISMYTVDTTTGAATLISGGPLKDFTTNKNMDVNGAGINSQDGFVYAIRDTINTAGTSAAAMLYRIGNNYSNYMVGVLPAPATSGGENLSVVNPAAGGFDDQGNYYYIGMGGAYSFTNNSFTPSSYYIGKVSNVAALTGGTGALSPTWTKIDFTNVACGTYKTSAFSTITSASGAGAGTSFQDITYSNVYRSLYVYAAYKSGANYMGQLLSINPTTGVATCLTPTANFGAVNNEVAGISTTANGSLLMFMTGGDIYKSTVAANGTYTGAMAKIGASGITAAGVMGSIRGDLASCGFGPTTLPAQPSNIVVGAPNSIVAYPNPSNGITTITVGQALNNATIRLVDVSGNIIAEKAGVFGTTFTMDMTGRNDGLYVVEVIEGGNVQKVKLIKK